MKVKIGNFPTWWGPYQIANLLQYVGVSEDRCHEIGGWLADKTPLSTVCEWIHSKRKRTMTVKLDYWDTWNMDTTLAIIVLPMLKQLKATKHGSPSVADEDVPEHLRSTNAPPKENEWDTDAFWHDRWTWVLDEMIWTFEQLHPDYDWEQQFHTGEIDITFEDSADGDGFVMARGPNDTHKFDSEGYAAHSARIDKGLVLFGKYFRALWD